MRTGIVSIQDPSHGILLAQKLFNPLCESDDFLSIVLFERRCESNIGKSEWVVWNHNAQSGGCFSGGYHSTQFKAWADFNSRGGMTQV